MKLKNVEVGMQVVVKTGVFAGRTMVVIGITTDANLNVRLVSDDGKSGVWLKASDIKPVVKQPKYDIPQKAMLLREVVVTDDNGDVNVGCSGYISGVCHDGFILVELKNFNEGHDGIHCTDDLLCGWTGKKGDVNYWFFSAYEIAYVNEDGSLTPVEDEVL